jgi:hypothetical protein
MRFFLSVIQFTPLITIANFLKNAIEAVVNTGKKGGERAKGSCWKAQRPRVPFAAPRRKVFLPRGRVRQPTGFNTRAICALRTVQPAPETGIDFLRRYDASMAKITAMASG